MSEEQANVEKPKERARDNVVLIGKKPNMAYVMATMTQLNAGQTEVHIKARGKMISHAVDVAEIVRNKFMPDIKVKEIKTGTEQVEVEGGGKIGVSTIELILGKK
jgi:DNA-binding protein